MNTHKQKLPWYREPWVWLLVALPLSAVIGGMITIYLAVTTSDGLVVDDYYKRGKEINQDLARDQAAAHHGLVAHVGVDLQYNRVDVQLESSGYRLPDIVQLSMLHPTRAGFDQVVQLQHAGEGVYRGSIDELSRGGWYVLLEADDWRLTGRIPVPRSTPAVLLPAVGTTENTSPEVLQ